MRVLLASCAFAAPVLAGCATAASHPPRSLASACARDARETEAVSRRVRSVLHGSSVLGAGAASPLRRAVQQASRETAAIDRATAAAIAGLAQTPGTRAALAQLARNERALLAPHSSQPLGLASSLFAYAEAAGGCRQARRAIGG